MKPSKKHLYSSAPPKRSPAATETIEQYIARGGRIDTLPALGMPSKQTDLTFKDPCVRKDRTDRKKSRPKILTDQDTDA